MSAKVAQMNQLLDDQGRLPFQQQQQQVGTVSQEQQEQEHQQQVMAVTGQTVDMDLHGEQDAMGEDSMASSGDEDNDDSQSKIDDHQQQQPVDPESAIKFLVPNYLAGVLIGKKGATIKDIQVRASCMVRIATSGMYFPGTMERAVLVAGDTEGVKKACGLILHTIHGAKHNVSGYAQLLSESVSTTIDITQHMLIPLTAGGLIIGRKGANIAALLEASSAKVTLGQKAEVKANERLVTIQGTLTAATKAVELLIDKLREEPAVSRFSNLSVSYRGHSSSQSKSSALAGIAPTAVPFQRFSKGGSTTPPASSVDPDAAATDDAEGNACPSSPAPSPAASAASPMAASPTTTASPLKIVSGGPAAMIGGRGMTFGAPARFQQQQQQQKSFRQSMQQPQQTIHQSQQRRQHQQIQHQQHHIQRQHQPHSQSQYQHQQHQQQPFHQQPRQHQLHGPVSTSPQRGPQQQQTQGQAQPMSPISLAPLPMMQMGSLGHMVSSDSMGAVGASASMPPLHGMGMAYAPAPAAAMYHPGVMQTSGGMGAVAGGPHVAGDRHLRGYSTMSSQQQHHPMFSFEPMTNPIAAAVAACQPTTTITVGIPNGMVGAILGMGGSTINELQSMSGARINVSQRDEYMPGTDNRILTITGPPMATQTAQFLVSRKIQEVAERPGYVG